MPTIYTREAGRGIDDVLRKFKRIIEKNGIPSEIRRRERHEKPTTMRKRKKQAAVKRHLKRVAREQFRGRTPVSRNKRESKRA